MFNSSVLLFIKVGMTEIASKNLVTFFSVAFGFYMTSIAILYKSSYAKSLYKQIDDREQQRGIHKLKKYLLASGRCSIVSIGSIILFTLFSTKNDAGVLEIGLQSLSAFFMNFSIDLNLLLASFTFGVSAVNVFFMILLFNTILDGMVEEARK